MTSYSSKEVIRLLEADGWELKNITGSHQQFKHPHKKGRATVQHPYKDIPIKTLLKSLNYYHYNVENFMMFKDV